MPLRAQTYILANTSSGSKPRSIPWGKLLSRKEVWAIIVCHFCHNWGVFILLTWMPTYYNQVGPVVARARRAGGAGAWDLWRAACVHGPARDLPNFWSTCWTVDR
jgi:hypothetical protein